MRILVDTFVLTSAETGIRTYCIELCDGLQEFEDSEHQYIIPGYQFFKKNGFFARRSNVFAKGFFHLSFLMWKLFILPILVLTTGSKGVLSLDYVLPVWPKFKGFVVFHDVFFWELKSHYNPIWRKYFTTLAEQGVKKDTVVIATSNYTKEKLRKLLFPSATIAIVYQSPHMGHFTDEALDPTQEKLKYFLHVGYYDKRKNLPVLIKAYAKYLEEASDQPKAKLFLAGGRAPAADMDDWHTITEMIEQMGLSEWVEQLGFVATEEMGKLYRDAFAFVFPSYDEGFGIPIVEAMRNGIPVIVSDMGASKEVLGGNGLVFRFDDPQNLTEHLLSLEDKTLYQRLGEASLRRSSDFSRHKFCMAIDQLISEKMP
ncbi:MAG: glycosyltransferase family 1 protein [Cytophagales bacterium]|nr:glycosyltransferase family 1 protein [Cytophagales bacterium]